MIRNIDFQSIGTEGSPVHFSVSTASDRRRSRFAACHVWNNRVCAGAFVRIADGLYVSSPETCFGQMASELSLVELAKVGFEFCGSYALAQGDPRGFACREPLTSVSALRRQAAKMTGLHGSKRACRASDLLIDGSASPMETVLAMLLSFPRSLGGYGLKPPRMNYRVEVSGATKGVSDNAFYCCDLFWPEAGLAVEYDSDMFHTGSERIAKDSKRRNALAFKGLLVVSVTRRQVLDARELDKVALVLAKRLGVRLRSERSDLLTRRFELRSALLDARIQNIVR